MFIKIIGSAFVIFAAIKIGLNINERQKRRILALEEIIDMLENFKIRFEYEQITVLRLLDELSNSDKRFVRDFASTCLCEIKRGGSFNNAWGIAAVDLYNESGVSRDTLNKLKDFASNLGKTALDGQLSLIEFYIVEFKKALDIEAEKMYKNSKINLSCSVFGGLIFVIILL